MGLITQTQQDYYNGNDYGNYQFTSLDNVINQFMVAYVGEGKTISKVKRVDVAFHAQRTLQELSFDTLKSIKAQEVTVPATLQMILPQDYVNYTKISWVDSSGIKHLMYPTSKTSNPSSNPFQNSDGEFKLQAIVGAAYGSSLPGIDDAYNDISLDGEYLDIEIGMSVSGDFIPPDSFVRNISTNPTAAQNGVTVFRIQNAAGNLVTPLDSTSNPPNTVGVGNILTFTRLGPQKNLLSKRRKNVIVHSLGWNSAGDSPYAIFGSSGDFTGLEVGMVIDNIDWLGNTTITKIADDHIVVDQTDILGAVASGKSLTFRTQDFVDTDTWANYKSTTPSENQDDYIDDTYWPMDGSRYGLDPQHAQANGSFYIDEISGKIHFSSNISGKTVVLDYISDSLGTDGEMQVHKFAEEAMYKCIAYAILSTRANVQEYIVRRFKKERSAAIRTAKLRLSNVKLEEITQILRGKSKQIKH